MKLQECSTVFSITRTCKIKNIKKKKNIKFFFSFKCLPITTKIITPRLRNHSKEIDIEIMRLKYKPEEDFPSIELIYKLKKECESKLKDAISSFFEKR